MFQRFAARVSDLVGSSPVFVLATVACLAWPVFDRPFDWLDAASALTLWLLFGLQAWQNADTRALHAKLDEIIRVEPEADDDLRGMEQV